MTQILIALTRQKELVVGNGGKKSKGPVKAGLGMRGAKLRAVTGVGTA